MWKKIVEKSFWTGLCQDDPALMVQQLKILNCNNLDCSAEVTNHCCKDLCAHHPDKDCCSFFLRRKMNLAIKKRGWLSKLICWHSFAISLLFYFTDHHLSLPGVCMHPAHHFALKIDNNQCLLIINHYCPNNSALQYYNSRFSNNTVLGNTCVTIVSPKMWKFEVNISLLQFSPVSSWTALERGKKRSTLHKSHMGQFLQGGKNGRLMSYFFLKVEPPCDQTWWDSLVFSILSCFSYVVDAENTLVGPVGPF